MARIRTVKPEFWTDSKTGTLSDRAARVFIGMLNHADDYGVIEHDLPSLKAKILPYSPEEPILAIGQSLVDELIPRRLVEMFYYSGNGGPPFRPYLFITNFHRHQKVDRPGKPLIEGWKKFDTPQTFDPDYLAIPPDSDPNGPQGPGSTGFDERSTSIRRTLDDHSKIIRRGNWKGSSSGKEGKGKNLKDLPVDNSTDGTALGGSSRSIPRAPSTSSENELQELTRKVLKPIGSKFNN